MNGKQMYKKTRSFAALAVLCAMLAMPLLAVADASTVAIINVAPTSDSKVITVIGNGFDPSEQVYLALANATTGVVVYNFTESITTSSMGLFTKEVTLPTLPYGNYYIVAKTSTVTAYKEYSLAYAANPKIAVTPPNSNIIKVAGIGFSPADIAAFTLLGQYYTSAFNFTDYAFADAQGNFTATLIIPTSLSGNYTLLAATRTGLTANASITVPDLTGPKGDTGEAGDRGPKGTAGIDAEAADGTLVYVAIIISVIAAVVSVASLLRDREPDED
ncbi:MAG: hypothetical protein NWE93_00500 [Candidatus Bathyarchaeota archaeon]|nr:hypothetical protein [Candidatus Bathyarchaeota archaeon]